MPTASYPVTPVVVKQPDFGTQIKTARAPKLDLVKVRSANLQRMVEHFGWSVVVTMGKDKRPGQDWDYGVNMTRGKLFAVVDVSCTAKPVDKLIPFYATGDAFYRTKQCTLTVRVSQGQNGPERRSEAVALARALLGTAL